MALIVGTRFAVDVFNAGSRDWSGILPTEPTCIPISSVKCVTCRVGVSCLSLPQILLNQFAHVSREFDSERGEVVVKSRDCCCQLHCLRWSAALCIPFLMT